ncbi:MAG: glucosamine--fructose-6-phosphate aminotransferase [Chloroflexi bacterium]|nr:glucosamine--fructose-6-phosphate aminotransferase [Chloroflexota bacterium]
MYIEQEIAEQPAVIQGLLDEESGTARRIAQAIRDFDPAFVWIAARGTSDNAGRYAQYLMGIQAGLPVGLATPSVHTLYDTTPRLNRALVIGISQSGQSVDVNQVVQDAREQGALTVTITNNPDSLMADTGEYHLPLHSGPELSIAATKTYTAELTAVAMLTAALVDKTELNEALAELPIKAAETLRLSENVWSWAERYRYAERCAVIGRGYNYSTAFEISLKLKELCYLTCQEYSEADFRHGPIAVVGSGFPVISVAPAGKTLALMVDLLEKLQERQAENLVISNEPSAGSFAQNFMPIPPIAEWLSPICAVMPGQILAMSLAKVKGYPVDQPRGLTKVTITT